MKPELFVPSSVLFLSKYTESPCISPQCFIYKTLCLAYKSKIEWNINKLYLKWLWVIDHDAFFVVVVSVHQNEGQPESLLQPLLNTNKPLHPATRRHLSYSVTCCCCTAQLQPSPIPASPRWSTCRLTRCAPTWPLSSWTTSSATQMTLNSVVNINSLCLW